MILVAVFGFVLALGIAIAARRPLAATLVVLVGAGWPATLAGAARGLGTGVAILVAVLVVLGGLTARRVPRTAVVAGGRASPSRRSPSRARRRSRRASSSHWQGWDFYNAPDAPVSVSFVWNAQYDGIDFPREADDGARDQGAAHGALLAGRAARPVRRRPLDRGAADDGRLPRAARGARPNDVDPPERHRQGARRHTSRRRSDARRPSTPATRRSTGRRPAARALPARADAWAAVHRVELRAPADAGRAEPVAARSIRRRSRGRRRCSTSGPASRRRRSGSHSAPGS